MTATTIPRVPLVDDQAHRAAAILPAAGGYTDPVASEIPPGSDEVSLVTTYTKALAAAAGSWKAQLNWYFQGEEDVPFLQTFADQSGVVWANPLMTVNVGQLVIQSGTVAGADPVRRVLMLRVPAGAVKVALIFAETGDLVNRGTLAAKVLARRRTA